MTDGTGDDRGRAERLQLGIILEGRTKGAT